MEARLAIDTGAETRLRSDISEIGGGAGRAERCCMNEFIDCSAVGLLTLAGASGVTSGLELAGAESSAGGALGEGGCEAFPSSAGDGVLTSGRGELRAEFAE